MNKLRLSFIVVGITLSLISDAQHTVPEKGKLKIELMKVMKADSLDKHLLFRNALKFVANLKNLDEQFELKLKDSVEGKLYGQSTFFVYAQAGILKKISGTITYQISIEVKDHKYRYCFTDFVFHYFKQDRYYKMVATGKTKMLEEQRAPGWQKLWAAHRATVINKMKANDKNIELTMAEDVRKVAKIVAKKIEW